MASQHISSTMLCLHMVAVLQACPCTHAAVCKADTFDLMDKKCRFKHNPVGSWNFIHGGGSTSLTPEPDQCVLCHNGSTLPSLSQGIQMPGQPQCASSVSLFIGTLALAILAS